MSKHLCLIALYFVLAACSITYFYQPDPKVQLKQLERDIVNIVTPLQDTLPREIDDVIIWNSIAAVGIQIRYEFTVRFSVDNINVKILHSRFRHEIRSNNCFSPGIMEIVNQGASVRYTFYDIDGTLLFVEVFRAKDCLEDNK